MSKPSGCWRWQSCAISQKPALIGVIDLPGSTPPDVVEARRLELQAWLSGPGKLSAHFVKTVAVCSFVRFRVDGSIDPDRDERRNLDVLGEVLTRELPGEAQVEMARLVSAKKVQLEISQHLGPIADHRLWRDRRAADPVCRLSNPDGNPVCDGLWHHACKRS